MSLSSPGFPRSRIALVGQVPLAFDIAAALALLHIPEIAQRDDAVKPRIADLHGVVAIESVFRRYDRCDELPDILRSHRLYIIGKKTLRGRLRFFALVAAGK
jgi:hypothetical protein